MDPSSSVENNILGPDFFGFFTKEVKNLLSQDDDLLPYGNQVSPSAGNIKGVDRGKGSTKNSCQIQENSAINGSSSLFSNQIGAILSDSKKSTLNSLLMDSVKTLTQEVDEMINPVFSVCLIRSCLRCKESLLRRDAITCKTDELKHPQRKRKASSASLDLGNVSINLSKTGKELSDDVVMKCMECHLISTQQLGQAPDGTKRDDDLRLILENDSTKVEELLKSHTSEISATLHHMEQNLEELLNSVMTTCRVMTTIEMQHLCKSIQNLPPENLERVAEIIERNKASENCSPDELRVDLEEVDNATLWRLYFYVATVKAARNNENRQSTFVMLLD